MLQGLIVRQRDGPAVRNLPFPPFAKGGEGGFCRAGLWRECANVVWSNLGQGLREFKRASEGRIDNEDEPAERTLAPYRGRILPVQLL